MNKFKSRRINAGRLGKIFIYKSLPTWYYYFTNIKPPRGETTNFLS